MSAVIPKLLHSHPAAAPDDGGAAFRYNNSAPIRVSGLMRRTRPAIHTRGHGNQSPAGTALAIAEPRPGQAARTSTGTLGVGSDRNRHRGDAGRRRAGRCWLRCDRRRRAQPYGGEMISGMRLFALLVRPTVAGLLAMFTATGLAQSGYGEEWALLARALVVVLGFLVFSVACNDLADEAIDRVNLPGQRPLGMKLISRRGFAITGCTAAAVALGFSATLHWPAMVTTAAGLAVSAGYSLRPVRLADRGALAALALPGCYVAVPYLVGVFAATSSARPGVLLLLAGLYTGFIGRIILKDFRDVRGDALFGKRTFLVRHGRRWTCAFSACCWAAGTGIMVGAVPRPTVALALAYGGCLAGVLWLLRTLAAAPGARRD